MALGEDGDGVGSRRRMGSGGVALGVAVVGVHAVHAVHAVAERSSSAKDGFRGMDVSLT